jgi:hypothetical protein
MLEKLGVDVVDARHCDVELVWADVEGGGRGRWEDVNEVLNFLTLYACRVYGHSGPLATDIQVCLRQSFHGDMKHCCTNTQPAPPLIDRDGAAMMTCRGRSEWRDSKPRLQQHRFRSGDPGHHWQ